MLTNTTEIGTATLPRRRLTIPAPTDVSPSAPRRPPRFPALAQLASAARRVPRAPIPVAVALAVLAVLATVAPEPAAAQTVTTFISNTGQTESGSSQAVQAVAFTTGTGTYTLSSVGIGVGTQSSSPTPVVKIYGDTGGNPGTTLVATMTNPGTIQDNAVNVFTAPANTTLSASTTYWVVTSNSAATNGQGFWVGVTIKTLDTGTAVGWSLGNARFKSDIAATSWTASNFPLRFAIRGTSGTTTNNPPTVANAIPDQSATAGTAFSYAFPANTFSDADTGDTLSYTATKADDTALPTWLAFAAATRMFSGTPTAAGTVSVEVTASDGNGGSVSDTFDITVAADPNAHCNALDTSELWCGTLTVGVSNVAYGYNAVLSFGSVAPLTFTHGGATITVNRLLYAGIRFQFGMSSALGAGDFSLEIGTGGAKRSFAMNNPGIEADFFNHGLSWSANETVPVKLLLVNTPATGAPAITGTAQVGQTLTATVGDIADVDGLPDPFLTDANTSFQWIRVATDNSETDISGAMAGAYTLVADDQGTTIKVKVSFTGNNGFAETRTSAATAAVSAVAAAVVPADWSLKPNAVAAGAKFRLLFLSSTKRNSTATDIATYNTFIQTRAAAGHTDIQDYSAGFRVVGCTAAVDARDNTSTTYTATDKGVPIYWLNGAKAADQYEDFYDGSWDDEANDKNESGTNGPDTSQNNNLPLTGCSHDGTELTTFGASRALGASQVSVGRPNSSDSGHGPLFASAQVGAVFSRPMYGLSAVFQVAAAVVVPNNPPTVANAIPDQSATAGTAFSYVFPANTFSDADTGDTLSYTATKTDDTALPTWLAFAASTRTFSGTPQAADIGTVSVKVTASDGNGGSVSDTFDITVAADTTPPTLTGASIEETDGLIINLRFSEDLQLSNPPPVSAFTVTVDGSAATVSSVLVPGSALPQNDLWLQLSTAIRQGQAVVVAYADPTTGNDANAIQDAAGNDAADFTTGMNGVPAVTNNSLVTNTPATGAPTITGTAQVGQTLTAGTTAIVDADGLTSVSYAYQWIRVATDNTETNISGATASTHTLVAADQGTTIKVKVSFTDDASNPETLTSAATAVVSAAANTPATGAPTITGTAQVGQTLTATVGTIADVDGLPDPFFSDAATTIAWIRVATDNTETNISTATASTYTLVTEDLGTTIKVKVSFTDDASNAETLTSAATAAVSAAPNTPATGAPTITGTAQVGQVLTATVGTIADVDGLPDPFFSDAATTIAWIRVATDNTETNISGATASTYTLVAADLGTTIKVRVSFTDDASNAETLTSAATAAVSAAPNTPATGAPTITGTAQVGQVLTATVGTIADVDGLPDPFFSDAATTIAWIRVATDNSETNIASATASTYTLVAADLGTTIKVRVSFTDDASNAETLTSAATAAVSAAANTPATGAPTITGTAQVGQTLTAGTTAIMDADGLTNVSYTYQWIRVDGGTETNIASATASTYTLVAADQGTTIKVTVSFTDDASNAETLTSAATAVVSAAANTPATGAPTITGTAQVGQTLTAGTAAIVDADGLTSVSYTYQWIRVATDNTETNISGATASTHTLVAADRGTTIKVKVSFTDDASNPETLTSAATAAVSAAPNTPATGAPTITGTAQVGQTLTAGTTAIMDADGLTSVSYTYQWIRVATDNTETNISGATASTYTLVAADLGTTVKVRVSFTDDASNTETLTSAATAVVSAAPNTPATGAPTITGTAQVGQTLTAGTTAIVDADGLTSVSYTYQWIRTAAGVETNISGATASTYTLVAADQGTTIKVRVSFTDDASNAETLTSATTAVVTDTTGQTTVTFGASSYTATEGGAAATVTVALSAAPSASVTIPLTTAHLNGATAADHAGIPATVTFGTNQTVMTFTVTATDDADTDGGESVQLGFGTLPAGYAPGARRTATVTLVDDDANLIVNFGTERHTTVKVLESDTVWHRFIFSLSTSRYGPPNGNPQQPVTIPLVVTHVGGAKAEEDYEGIPKSVTFEVGQSVTDFSMRAIPDGKREPGEGLRLDFGQLPAGVRKGTWGPYETIAFVDQVLPGYTVLFGAEAYTATEGGAPARVSIHLSEPVEIEPLVVGLVVTHVGATAADYTGIPKSVRFGVGEQTQTITVTATDDTDDDDGESVTLSFVNDPNGRVRVGTGPASATVALADNDGTRRVTVSFGAVTYTATEGGADATVRVELDAAPGRSVTVPLTKAHLGNATAADYSGIPMNVTFAANQTSRTFAVMATAGDGSDGGESVSIGFGTLPEGVFAGSPAATTVTLADGGEQRLVVNFGSSRGHTVQVREGARRLRLNVLLDSSPRRPVTIPLVVTHVGGATEADYAAIPESVTFAAGQTSAHYYVRALPDEEDKTGEGLQLDFGPLPPGVRKGTWGPYETIDFLDPDPTALLPAFAAFRLLTSGNASAQDSVESDRAVLVALYNATDGPNWTGNTHWLSNEPLSEWRGVGVNDDGRVTALWLFGNQLTGEIPVELSQLSQLQLLYLSSNQLTGEIPVELSQLSQLQDLSLDSNQLTGEIPVELSQLSQLQLLYLSSNRLTGEIPAKLGDLAQLNGLYLHGNELNGPIPSWLVNLTELRELSLWSNRLTGTIPPEVAPAQDRAALVVLYLQTDGPNWTGNTHWLSNEPLSEWRGVSTDEQGRVEELRLSANGLNGTIGAELGVLTRLTGLYLNDNELTGTIPPELENLTQLQVFDIRNTGLCVTADSELHTWIATIQDFQGTATCGASNLVANFVNGNNGAFNSRVYLWNPSESSGDVTVRVFTLPLTGGLAQELTAAPLNLGTLGAKSALNVKVAEDILAPLGITLPYTNNEGDLTLEFTIQAVDVRGATQVFSSSLAFGTHPLQEIPSTSSGSPTVLVANFMNGNSDAFSSRAYLFNPSDSDGTVTVRVFTLPLSDGTAQELTVTPLDLGTLEARSALNLKLAEDILTPLGITTPYTTDGGNLTLEFTIQAADARGAAQVFSSSFAFGVYPLQEIPSTSSGSPTVLVANFMNGNSDAFSSRAYLFNPSDSDGAVTVRVFTLPLSDGTAQELTVTPLDLGTLGARSALNLKLVEDILIPLGIALPYVTDGGNLTLEFTIQAADARGVAQVFSSDFAFGTYPMQEIPSTSSGSPTVLVANFMNGNDAALNSRVYLWNPSLSAGSVTVRVFTLPLTAGVAQELTTAPLDLGTLGAESARNLKLVEDILTPLGIPTPYVTDGGNLTLEFTIQAADVRGAAQVFSSSFAFGTVPLQVIQ